MRDALRGGRLEDAFGGDAGSGCTRRARRRPRAAPIFHPLTTGAAGSARPTRRAVRPKPRKKERKKSAVKRPMANGFHAAEIVVASVLALGSLARQSLNACVATGSYRNGEGGARTNPLVPEVAHPGENHRDMPASSARAITSSSRSAPPGWITAVAPASIAASRPSAKAGTRPRPSRCPSCAGRPARRLGRLARPHRGDARRIAPVHLARADPRGDAVRAKTMALDLTWRATVHANSSRSSPARSARAG